MDVLTFIQKLISSLVWPAVVIAVILLFRHQIAARIRDVKRVKGPGGFEVELERIEALAVAVDERIEARERRAPPPAEDERTLKDAEAAVAREADVVDLLAAGQPRAAILASWIVVEMEASDAAERLGLTAGTVVARAPSLQRTISLLAREGLLSDEAVELARSLQRIRNAAVHEPDFAPTQQQAAEFTEAALSLARLLRAASRRDDSSKSD